MNYIIQTKKENNNRVFNVNEIIDSSGVNQEGWTNYKNSFATMDKAAAECQSMIESGNYKAQNIRVVQVAMVFKSKTVVEQLKP